MKKISNPKRTEIMKRTTTPGTASRSQTPTKAKCLRRLGLAATAAAALLGAATSSDAQTLTTSWTNTFDTSATTAGYAWWYDLYQSAYGFGSQTPITNSFAAGTNSTLPPPPSGGAGSGALTWFTYWPGVPANSGKGGQTLIFGAFGGGNPFDFSQTIDATKYDSFSFDLYADPDCPLNQASNVCSLTVGFILNNYSVYTISNAIISTNNLGKWMRYVCPINKATAPAPPGALAAGPMFNINCYGGQNANLYTNTTAVTKLWIDNLYLKLSTVVAPPPTMSKAIVSPHPGLNLFSGGPSTDQFQRNSIKLISNTGVGWLGQQGVTYSMTLTNFPDGAIHSGYQAHLFITTGPGTASALDYNETNVVWLNIQANSNNTGVAYFRYKINEWAANSNMFGPEYIGIASAGTLTNLQAPTVLGTWTLTFNNDTNVTITGPGSTSVNFNMRPEAVAPFTDPLNIVYGAQPNQPYNVGQEVVYAAVSGTNSGMGLSLYNDNFLADSSLDTGTWTILTGEPNTVFVFPFDPGEKIVSWSLPANGFSLQTSSNVPPPHAWTTLTGPDATVPPITTWTSSGNEFALVPSSDQDTNQSFFRLFTRAFTKLQVLMPGEVAAPGTASGKTGTPDAQSIGTAFNVTVNAVDANWNPATYNADDIIHITSSDGTATLPADSPLVSGTAMVSVTFNTNGTFTVTTSDVTRPSKTANTGSPTTVP
jgi:hypothetical protein